MEALHNALDKSERKEFDEMWDIPRLYVSACSNSVQLVPLQPIIISILFHHYKELNQCINQVEQMSATATIGVNNKQVRKLIAIKGEQKEEKTFRYNHDN
jgi:hypothetical protein